MSRGERRRPVRPGTGAIWDQNGTGAIWDQNGTGAIWDQNGTGVGSC